MKLTLYVRRASPVHALPARWKLGLMLIIGLLILSQMTHGCLAPDW